MKYSSLAAVICSAIAMALPAASVQARSESADLEIFQEAMTLSMQSQQSALEIGGVAVHNPAHNISVEWDARKGAARIIDLGNGTTTIHENERSIYGAVPKPKTWLTRKALAFLSAERAKYLRVKRKSSLSYGATFIALTNFPGPTHQLLYSQVTLPVESEKTVLAPDQVRYRFHFAKWSEDYGNPHRDHEPVATPVFLTLDFTHGLLTMQQIADHNREVVFAQELSYRSISVAVPQPNEWVSEYNFEQARQWVAGARKTKRSAKRIKRDAVALMQNGRTAITAIRDAAFPQRTCTGPTCDWGPACTRIKCQIKKTPGGVRVSANSKFGTSWATVTWHSRKNKIVIRSGQRQNLANAPQPSDTATTAATASAESQQVTKKGGSS